MLYGNYVVAGKIDLIKTVKELGLQDVQAFLPFEDEATLLDLMRARSGIYHPSGNKDLTSLSPRRGSQVAGTYFQYQNWDFNAAGTAFEKLTGKDIFDALESDLARPIGMQDFDRSKQRKNSSMPDSVHPEYAMYLTTRGFGLPRLKKHTAPSPTTPSRSSLCGAERVSRKEQRVKAVLEKCGEQPGVVCILSAASPVWFGYAGLGRTRV